MADDDPDAGDGSAWLAVYLKGFAMGAADAVPGVSGGTIALITGIYDRLVTAIAGIGVDGAVGLLRDLARSHRAVGRAAARERAVAMELPFLAALGFGVLTAVVTAANVIHVGVERFPGPTYAFFVGLIVASVYVLRDEFTVDSPRGFLVAVAGFLLAFVASGTFQGSLGSGLPIVFLSGAVAVSAMVLPGISGSLILLALGQYELMVGSVGQVTDAVLAGTPGAAVAPMRILTVFALGASVGVLSIARVVAWALETDRVATMTFLIALMAGALRAPGAEILAATETWSPPVALGLLAVAAVGGSAVLLLDAMTAGIDY
jgi:putative membrane protein